MPISSRTPEGDPNRCPICGNAIRIEPSMDTRDAPCPHCGHLLWFETTQQQAVLISGAKYLLMMGTKRLGPPTDEVRKAIGELHDATTLEKIADRLLSARNWQELLETN